MTVIQQTLEVVDLIAELHVALKLPIVSKMPDGIWEYQVDKQWCIAVNGGKESVSIPDKDGCMGIGKLEPFHFAVWYNGWLAGILTPFDGVLCAGESANENTFAVALRDAIKAIKHE